MRLLIRRAISWVGQAWVAVSRRAPWAIHLSATAVLGFIIRVVMVAFGLSVPAPQILGQVQPVLNIVGEISLDILITLLSFYLITQFTRFSLGPLFPALALIRDVARGTARGAILGLADGQLNKLRDLLVDLRSENGAPLDTVDRDFATRVFFENAQNGYDGTESHIPSQFANVYPDYLDAHAKNLESAPKNHPGARILLASRSALVHDADQNPEEYRRFVAWHREHRVRLLQIEPSAAKESAEEHELSTTAIGIWYGQYAVLFTPIRGTGQVVLKMIVPQEAEYTNCVRYFQALLKDPRTREVPYVPELFEEELENKWQDFVNPAERLILEGPFLLKHLTTYKSGRILDAAVGIGCESIFLAKHGFDVTSNEIGHKLAEIAKTNARREGIGFEYINYDWRELNEAYPQPKFDAVLVLGNSLCLVTEKGERRKCIENFFHILLPNGVLIIDERNFPRILGASTTLRKDVVTVFNRIYKGTVMYCGKTIRGCPDPDTLANENIAFAYYDNTEPKDTWEKARKAVIGHLEMYPFQKGELSKLLADCGFTDIKVYSDLHDQEGYKEDADFFTYVAFKH